MLDQMALAELPTSEMYEKSYMHRDTVTHLIVTPSDFIITASRDGQLKFWKKQQTGIEFVKHFRAHLAPISGLSATTDGTLLASSASDKGLKASCAPATSPCAPLPDPSTPRAIAPAPAGL